ncbi:hypothetical protein A6X21_18635 [Planctopirus hydrillae]|uniref:Uncharacterized protein n=1 Tax=Planctopirus hydrillae TaxID=1841610 RepID=A0A1C3EK08_9PLAN|nr:hypothetical protein A6X21_18635 [Planctopirus hydrillae]
MINVPMTWGQTRTFDPSHAVTCHRYEGEFEPIGRAVNERLDRVMLFICRRCETLVTVAHQSEKPLALTFPTMT